jgi:hypothetical protein
MPITLKPNDFMALYVEHFYELINSSKKGYETKLVIPLTNLNFTYFYVNTQCLMR